MDIKFTFRPYKLKMIDGKYHIYSSVEYVGPSYIELPLVFDTDDEADEYLGKLQFTPPQKPVELLIVQYSMLEGALQYIADFHKGNPLVRAFHTELCDLAEKALEQARQLDVNI